MKPPIQSKPGRWLGWALLAGAVLLSSACSVSPHANMGLDVDYYNGSFHVRPEAHVGIYGRPN